jgi:FkbM family methyltransferase
MPLKNYLKLARSIKNWPLYFRKKFQDALYITRGAELEMEVPKNFFYVFKEIFMEDFYSIDDLLKHIPEVPTVVDVGGNVGYFSFLIASKRKGAKVFAYEPMIDNVKIFQSNLHRNKSLEERIKLKQKAVTGTEQSSISLFFDDMDHNTVIASVYPEFSNANKREIRMEAVSLSRIIEENGLKSIDLLKMDCEGSEYPILYDSPASIWPFIQCLAIEVHELDSDKMNFRYLSSFIRDKGFEIKSRLDPNSCYYLMAYRN